ncbi:MAG: DUF4145 domain-containing protein [Hyphomonas oceanitis]|uniref:DUF4145 domain-containing protein n=1 Tax=Hyphomonas oceanitis TaxID=81033 RepID=UPI0030011574
MKESEHGWVGLEHTAVGCPNAECRKLTLVVMLRPAKHVNGTWKYQEPIEVWPLLPKSRAKPQPHYIPEALRRDYVEACLILNDSPKASATMSRRCLQGLVRDFWEIPEDKRGNLGAELNFIKNKIDPSTWDVIKTIREVGDIGAHMEKDVNYVVDVEPEEASLLLELIEALFEDWYVSRQKRLDRDERVKLLAEKKLEEKRDAKRKSKEQDKKPDADPEPSNN